MHLFSNLISDSVLVNDTIELLKETDGTATANTVLERVLKIQNADDNLAKLLVKDVVDSDPRLTLNDTIVELKDDNHSARDLFESDYIVFDFETTGAKTPPCRVTEVGAFRVSNGKIGDEFHTLVNPDEPIPPFITDLTGISDEMVADAPKFAEIIDPLLDFIGDSILVAHNALFDVSFLNSEINRVYENYKIRNPHICTVKLSRKLVRDVENHKLATLAVHFGIPLENHHRASDDARATATIFLNLLERLQERGVRELSALSRSKF